MSRRINHSLTYTYKKSILNLENTLSNILQNNNPNIRASRRKSTMKFPKNINPLSLIDINKKESKLNNLLQIISKKYKDRTEDDNETIYRYFLQIDIEEKFINDLLQINISPSKLFNYMKPYIKGIKYSFKDNIYTISDKAEYTYIILKGKVNLYDINIKPCKLNSEEYYLYLYNCFLEAKKISDKNVKEIGDEFVDNYIISHIIEENQNIFPIFSYQDLDKLKEIIFKVKIFLDISENKGINLEKLYDKYNYPKNLYNYNDYKEGKIKLFKLENMLHETFSDSEKFYSKIMSDVFHICKKIKYVCKIQLKEGDIFGNYEIINSKPKREETSKVISKNCLILSINKKEYSNKIFAEEKTDLDYEIDDIHGNFFFRSLDYDFFYKNIFSKFKISNLLQKNILFNENTKLNNIYIIKEGLIDVHIQNISLLDLRILISSLYSKIKDKIKIDFNFDNDLNIPLKKLKSILNEKYSFNLFTCEKVIFGDIEFNYNIKSFYTTTIKSDKCVFYILPIEIINDIKGHENIKLRKSLDRICLMKTKNIIERLINVYNSFFLKYKKEYNKHLKEEEKKFIKEENLKLNNKFFSNSNKNIFVDNKIKNLFKNNSNYVPHNTMLFKEMRIFNEKLKEQLKKKRELLKKNYLSVDSDKSKDEKCQKQNKKSIEKSFKQFFEIKKKIQKKIFLPSLVLSERNSFFENNYNNKFNQITKNSSTPNIKLTTSNNKIDYSSSYKPIQTYENKYKLTRKKLYNSNFIKTNKIKKNNKSVIKIKKDLCNFQNEKINQMILYDNYNSYLTNNNIIKNKFINLTNN